MEEKNKFIIVSGYGWSGSSVVIDYLKEFENTFVPDIEFRLIKDPYGLYELEQSLIHNWDYINSNYAILDFLWLCKKCAYTRKSIFSPMGLGYETKLNPEFIKISEKYVSSISSFKYRSSSIISKFKKKTGPFVVQRCMDALYRKTGGVIGKEDKGSISYFSTISEEKFLSNTQKYLEDVFKPFFSEDKIVVLDQAISPLHIDCLKYFTNAKMIIVDRNPADIYTDLIKSKGLIGRELASTRNPDIYVQWHNAIRSQKVNNNNILYLNFEDMVLKYDETCKKLKDFIEWDLGNHISPKQFFNPSISKNNVNFGICDACSEEEYKYVINNVNAY